jgi:16S rRNA G966 N2-methylase RsmD
MSAAALSHLPELLRVPRTDAVYNCHPYLTKVPIGAIGPFIEALTEPGQTVMDMFAGSGMTGVAAVKLGRTAELSDISALGQHIAQGYLADVDPKTFRAVAKRVAETARKAIGDLYTAKRKSDSAESEMVRAVWSFVYKCPKCSYELVYYDNLSSTDHSPASCPKCGADFVRRNWERVADVPVEVVVRDKNGRLKSQRVTAYDQKLIDKAGRDKRQKKVPSLPIDEHREMFSRSGLRKAGLSETRDFFSARNAIALLELWQAINAEADLNVRGKLRFCFTAMLARASRRYQWSRKTPLNAQNQTYYISPIYYEWNIFELFERKVEAAMRSDSLVFGGADLLSDSNGVGASRYTLASAAELPHLESGSVDYVFTDPPFGSNIFYSDMNLFHEAWLGIQTDPADEAVVYTTGKRKATSAERYESLLQRAFREAHRVLKDGGCMSVVFGNSSGEMWGIFQRALAGSGFDPIPTHVCVLDKGQRSVKGLASGTEGTATLDLVLTVAKAKARKRRKLATRLSPDELLLEVLGDSVDVGRTTASHVYALVLRRAIMHGMALDDVHLRDVIDALGHAGLAPDRRSGVLIPSGKTLRAA